MTHLAQHVKFVEAIKPQTGASARSGDWISLKNYAHVTIVVQIAMGNAATTAITVDKATAVAGTGESTGINLLNWYRASGDLTASDTMTKGTAATSITTASTGSGSEVYVIEIDATELGDFDCIQVELGSSNAANLVSAVYILSDARFAGAIGSFPSAIVD
jgi:hypothetical protein